MFRATLQQSKFAVLQHSTGSWQDANSSLQLRVLQSVLTLDASLVIDRRLLSIIMRLSVTAANAHYIRLRSMASVARAQPVEQLYFYAQLITSAVDEKLRIIINHVNKTVIDLLYCSFNFF